MRVLNLSYRLTALLSGLLFGFGLLLSGMTNPANIIAFLDVSGHCNPALAVVMASAIAVATPAFLWLKRQQRTLLGEPIDITNRRPLDTRLIAGSAIFGIGWGLSGICPGPGLILAASLSTPALIFVACMSVGMLFSRHILPALTPPTRTATTPKN